MAQPLPDKFIMSMNRVSKVVPPKRTILKDISLSFFPGAKIGVLGLNGSGKSTLLRIMAGVDKEFEGDAVALAGTKIGYLPQEPKLDENQTVREAVEEAVSPGGGWSSMDSSSAPRPRQPRASGLGGRIPAPAQRPPQPAQTPGKTLSFASTL